MFPLALALNIAIWTVGMIGLAYLGSNAILTAVAMVLFVGPLANLLVRWVTRVDVADRLFR